MRRFISYSTVVSMAALLGGCAVGPDFKMPALDLGAGWFNSPAEAQATPISAQWWTQLNDPVLDQLVNDALTKSPNIAMAEARVQAARAQRLQAQAAFSPAVNATGSGTYQKLSSKGLTTPVDRTTTLFSAGFDASWELDIFGGKRRTAEAARANLAAARADYANARLSLIADVVATYTDYRLAEERIRLAEANITAQQRVAELTTARFNIGEVNGLDAAQANSQLAATRANLPTFRQQKEVARGTLAILLGQLPNAFAVSPGTPINEAALPEVPAGLPSKLLERRPDIILAQQQLRSANALVGTAEAARFPSFSLTAGLGSQSRQFSDLLSSGSDFWSLGPSIGLPLLDAGSRRAVVRQREAEFDQYDANYTQVVLNALREVESSLTGVREERARLDDLRTASEQSQRALTLSDALYRAGEQNLLPVLDAQRSLFSAQDSMAQSHAALIQNWVALVKALGGGYVAPGTTAETE